MLPEKEVKCLFCMHSVVAGQEPIMLLSVLIMVSFLNLFSRLRGSSTYIMECVAVEDSMPKFAPWESFAPGGMMIKKLSWMWSRALSDVRGNHECPCQDGDEDCRRGSRCSGIVLCVGREHLRCTTHRRKTSCKEIRGKMVQGIFCSRPPFFAAVCSRLRKVPPFNGRRMGF